MQQPATKPKADEEMKNEEADEAGGEDELTDEQLD